MLVAQVSGVAPRVMMPKAEREARLNKAANVNVLDTFLLGVGQRSVAARRTLTRVSVAVEVLPALMHIRASPALPSRRCNLPLTECLAGAVRPLSLTTSGSHGGQLGRLSHEELVRQSVLAC